MIVFLIPWETEVQSNDSITPPDKKLYCYSRLN